jgi:hypothetical protein
MEPGFDGGRLEMTALGPAGFALIAFVGAVAALTVAYSVERYVRRALGSTPAR